MLTKTKNNKKLYLVTAFLLIVVFISAAIASTGQIRGGEARLLLDINRWPDSLKQPFLFVTYLGSEFFLVFLVVYLWLRRQRALAARLFVLSACTYVAAWVAKHVISRPRPAGLISNVIVRQTESGYGFPSAHAAVVAVMALTVCRAMPKSYRWQVAAIWVAFVGLSRIYLGVHAPLDVVGGFALGALVGLVPDYLDLPMISKKLQKVSSKH